MSILSFLKNTKQRDFTQELEIIRRDFRRLKFDTQGFVDAMTGEESTSTYGTNNFRNYAAAVTAVNAKYENQSAWGNGLTANIIDFRAAVTVSSGPQCKPSMDSTIKQKDDEGDNVGGEGEANGNIQAFEAAAKIEEDAQAEMDFCRDFFGANDINHETPQAWGREGEIEGRVAVKLEWDKTLLQVKVEHIPWLTYKYTEVKDKENPKIITGIKWEANQAEGIPAGKCEGDNLVYRRFSGRASAKYPTTKVMRCLTQIEYVDQAFRDWREINRLYASPIPIFECETAEAAEDMNASVSAGLNFKIKKAFALHGAFKFVGPEMTGIDSLEREIKRQACFISGTTGYPLQFLLPDMLSNRSTSENIMESAMIHTASEREIWIGFYEELVKKAMALYKIGSSKTPLDPNKIAISISLMTAEQWTRLTQFWLPAFREDLVTREAVLAEIPNFNIQDELDRRTEKDTERVNQISAELDKVKKDADANAAAAGNNQAGNFPPKGLPQKGQEDDNGKV